MKIWVFCLLVSFCMSIFYVSSLGYAIEVASRISDREIIVGLANIRGDIKEVKADIRRLEDGQMGRRI